MAQNRPTVGSEATLAGGGGSGKLLIRLRDETRSTSSTSPFVPSRQRELWDSAFQYWSSSSASSAQTGCREEGSEFLHNLTVPVSRLPL